VLAWVSTGLAVVGAGALVGGSLMAEQRYGDTNSEGTFQWHRAALLAGNETQTINGSLVDHRAAAGALKAEIETWQTVAFVGLGTAAAGALAATVFFVIGDPPGKYDAYREAPKVSLTLTPGLGGAVLSGRF
jgi:phosphoribosylformylglycinamidine (FGAM) synthase-like enzyme